MGMITQNFEIKVALLGYVSVGKTTVLNALFRDKFSEVSMRRTTAGVNFFRVVTPGPEEALDEGEVEAPRSSATDPEQWSVLPDEPTRTAADILKEIEESNRELREAGRIEEKWFNIKLDRPLCEMRKDTQLVIVDVPGINEAETSSIYKKYTNDNWKNFDCVVAVMDAGQGVNTEEQLEILKLIKTNLATKKQLPVIILFNKVDEPEDSGQALLVSEAREKISELFEVDCSERQLQEVLDGKGNRATTGGPGSLYPVFIPMSAVHAFFYRTASLLAYEIFKEKFDVDLIEKIGREEMGRFRWKKLSREEKYKAVFKVIHEDSNYVERLESTNFDKFLCVLSRTVGGEDVQKALLQNQLDIVLESVQERMSVAHFRAIYDKSLLLKKDLDPIREAFWSAYDACEEHSLKAFSCKCQVESLAKPIEWLQTYASFADSVGWKSEVIASCAAACVLVRRQLGVVIKHQDLSGLWTRFVQNQGAAQRYCTSCNNPPCAYEQPKSVSTDKTVDQNLTWKSLTYWDWLSIFESFQLMSFNTQFCEEFGREKILLSHLKHQYAKSSMGFCKCLSCDPGANPTSLRVCSNCGKRRPLKDRKSSIPCVAKDFMPDWCLRFEDGMLEPDDTEDLLKLTIPASLSHQSHWGHVAWKCCKLLADAELGADWKAELTPRKSSSLRKSSERVEELEMDGEELSQMEEGEMEEGDY